MVSEAQAQTFVKGAGISWTPQMEANGYSWHNSAGEEQDVFTIRRVSSPAASSGLGAMLLVAGRRSALRREQLVGGEMADAFGRAATAGDGKRWGVVVGAGELGAVGDEAGEVALVEGFVAADGGCPLG